MDKLILVITASGVGVMGVWIAMRRWLADGSRHGPSDDTPIQIIRNSPSKRRRFYYGVSVQPGPEACKDVEKIRSQRFLTTEAPKLPLPGCSRSHCRCTVIPEDDRRAGFDRRGDSFAALGELNLHERKRRRKASPDRRDK
jgi:hypothetical protein